MFKNLKISKNYNTTKYTMKISWQPTITTKAIFQKCQYCWFDILFSMVRNEVFLEILVEYFS